jgi:hypothetical protein
MRRRLSLLVFFCVLLLGGAAPAWADSHPPHPPHPSDPCRRPHGDERGGEDDPCHNIPEAPNALIYPIVGGAVVLGFVAFERRRRRRADALA